MRAFAFLPAYVFRFRFWLIALACLFPLLCMHGLFSDMFWFGDDWDHLDQIDRMGFWIWVGRVFAENWVPLFKLAWGGIAVGTGSHLLMIWVLWLAHAATVACYASMLCKAGLSLRASVLAALVFGLSSANVETLAWSTQGSAVMACFFFVLAATWYQAHVDEECRLSLKGQGGVILLSVASCLCFSRGILAGAAIAGACLLQPPLWREGRLRFRLLSAVLFLLPGILAALVIIGYASGNHRSMGGAQWLEAMVYGLWNFALNPFFRILDMDSWGWITVSVLLVLKIGVMTAGLRLARGRLRSLLLILLLFELGSSLLLGIGRFHTGLEASISSRYQYSSLLCTLPFVAILFETFMIRAQELLPGFACRTLGVAVILLSVFWVGRGWPAEMASFSEHRGRYTRDLLFVQKNPPAENAVPGINFLSTARAKELAAKYNLH